MKIRVEMRKYGYMIENIEVDVPEEGDVDDWIEENKDDFDFDGGTFFQQLDDPEYVWTETE